MRANILTGKLGERDFAVPEGPVSLTLLGGQHALDDEDLDGACQIAYTVPVITPVREAGQPSAQRPLAALSVLDLIDTSESSGPFPPPIAIYP